MDVVVTKVGINTPFGRDNKDLVPPFGKAFQDHQPLTVLSSCSAGIADSKSFRKYLKRRKDAKLFSPAAKLALDAAGQILDAEQNLDREELGLFVAVGREPPDEGEAEASLVASHSNGQLDEQLLALDGRRLYPPLLPLRTLPNMILAHISINLNICGENATWAGEAEAGLHVVRSAYWAIKEGRCDAAIAGGADSLVSLGLARDRLRLGKSGFPGQAAVMFLMESQEHAKKRGVTPLAKFRHKADFSTLPSLSHLIGDCGAVDALVPLAQFIIMREKVKWGTFEVSTVGDLS